MADYGDHTISNIAIGQAQKEIEQTPSDPFLPPQVSGSYQVDPSVIAGSYARNIIFALH